VGQMSHPSEALQRLGRLKEQGQAEHQTQQQRRGEAISGYISFEF